MPNSISRIISGSILSGGALIFVEEGMTPGAKELFELLQHKLIGKIAFSKLSLMTLLSGLKTQRQDVLFLGDILESQTEALAGVCIGKVVKCSAAEWLPSLFDVTWNSQVLSVNKFFSLIEALSSEVTWKQLARDKEAVPSVRTAVALFLDRDDVIVRNVPYNKDPEKVVLLPGISQLINRAHQNNELVIVCSNQSGIGRGLVSQEQYRLVHQRMLKLLSEAGAWVDDCFWASYIESSVLPDTALEPQMRKPRPGMFLEASHKWGIDMRQSRMIGDSATDLVAAHHAGIKALYLLASEKIEQEKVSLAHFQKHLPVLKYKILLELESI